MIFCVLLNSWISHLTKQKFGIFYFKFIDWLWERETSVCCSTCLCIHWLLLICALGIEPTTLAHQDNTLTNSTTWPGLRNLIHFKYMSGSPKASFNSVNYRPLIFLKHFFLLCILVQMFLYQFLCSSFYFLFYCCFSKLVEEFIWGFPYTWSFGWSSQTFPGVCILDFYILKQMFDSVYVYRCQPYFGRRTVFFDIVVDQIKTPKQSCNFTKFVK